ncbi:MAG: MauE/DoxX family redox-associated membrane protein [Acidimicrobiia bacterium]
MTWAAVLLGLVFIASGASKVFSPTWPDQAARLGSPRTVARALPFAELLLGILGAGDVARTPVVSAMAVLLVMFTAVLVRAIASGNPPPCACFGGMSTRPVGWWSVIRNLALLALAAGALIR